jgi:hypothetical protein
VASQRVEDVRSVRGLQVREHEEAARSGGDDFVLAEKREVLAQDAPEVMTQNYHIIGYRVWKLPP